MVKTFFIWTIVFIFPLFGQRIDIDQNTTVEVITPDTIVEVDAEDTENIVNIDMKARAADYEHAFRQLRRQDPTAKIYAVIGGESLDNIINVQVMPEQTLVVFTTSSRHRTFQKVAKTEEIEEFGTRGSARSKISLNFSNRAQ